MEIKKLLFLILIPSILTGGLIICLYANLHEDNSQENSLRQWVLLGVSEVFLVVGLLSYITSIENSTKVYWICALICFIFVIYGLLTYFFGSIKNLLESRQS